MGSTDTEHRRLCHTLLDALERGDVAGVAACYAPEMTLWFNVTGEESGREENLAAIAAGGAVLRHRTYNDRVVNTFDDGFMAQYTVNLVTHDGRRRALSACLVAKVQDARIVRLDDYIDSARFPRPREQGS